MFKRAWFSVFTIIVVTAFLLASCGPPPVAKIDSITHSPDLPLEGEEVLFTINYYNSSSEESLRETVLEVDYDKYLIYLDSVPMPDDRSETSPDLTWKLGTLEPGQTGYVEVKFEVSSGIPKAIYELSLEVDIKGTTSEGNLSLDSQQTISNLLGHPTPTPTPPPVVDTYSDEGVRIELPWQENGKTIHSEKRDFDFDLMMTVPVAEGYRIIRPVIYLDVVDQDENVVNYFSPSITLIVDYSETDLNEVESAEDLVILLFDRNLGIWIPCIGTKYPSTTTQCSATDITQSDGDTGYGMISIDAWTSGAGWGRR